MRDCLNCGVCDHCIELSIDAAIDALDPGTSGHDGFDHTARERFIIADDKVKMLPDKLGGQFTTVMTPEQAEFLARHLMHLSAQARRLRGLKYPDLYPEDV